MKYDPNVYDLREVIEDIDKRLFNIEGALTVYLQNATDNQSARDAALPFLTEVKR